MANLSDKILGTDIATYSEVNAPVSAGTADIASAYNQNTVLTTCSISTGFNFRCVKIGNLIAITADDIVDHSSGVALWTTDPGIIPVGYRPSSAQAGVRNFYGGYALVASCCMMVNPDGSVQIFYQNPATGGLVNRNSSLTAPQVVYVSTQDGVIS